MADNAGFVIRDGVLQKYTGSGGNVAIPEGVTRIGRRAFYGCRALTGVAIYEGVTEIGEGAFGFCTALTEMTIPGSVKRVGNAAFWCCESMRRAVLEPGVAEIGNEAFFGCGSLADLALPASVTRIGDRAFFECRKLTHIAVPARVTAIGKRAFMDCWQLADVTLPGGLAVIEDQTFLDCYSLRRVRVPERVTRIGGQAFAHCLGLERVELPAGLTQIDAEAFCGCGALTDLALPEGLTAIGENAFSGCAGLAEVAVPEGLTRLGRGAFSDCAGLVAATVTDRVDDFGVFSGCGRLSQYRVSRASRRYRAANGVVFSADGRRLIAYPPGRRAARYDIPDTAMEVCDYAFASAPVGLIFVPAGVERFSKTAAAGDAAEDPFVATGNAAFIPQIGKPVYLGLPQDLSNRNRRRAIEGFLYALKTGMPEIEPWKEAYVDDLRQEYGAWEKRAWRDETLLGLMMERRMLRAETARNMLRKFSAAGRREIAAGLAGYIGAAEE